MRIRVVPMAFVSLLIAACGSGSDRHAADQGRDAASSDSKEVRRALDGVAAAAKREKLPHDASFRVSYSSVAGKDDDLDLLNAVTDPMIDSLSEATPAQAEKRLSAKQYRVWALFTIDVDVSDGGVSEIYVNSSGDYATGGVKQLVEVGAPRHAAALRAANRVLWPDGRVPRGMEARRRRGAHLDDRRFDAATRAWDLADRAEGDLDAILARYIRAHLSSFFTP